MEMSKLQELRELIIKANKTELKYIAKLDKKDLAGKGFEHSLQSISKTGWREEPIDLAMVLMALGNKSDDEVFYSASSDGYISEQTITWDGLIMTRNRFVWDFTEDLDNQTEETISELLKLIKKEA
jgi:hypothetical protein